MDNMLIDFNAMIKQAYDMGMIEMLASLGDSKEDKKNINKILNLFYKYGIRPEDSIKLLIELMEIFGTESEGEENV